MVRGSNIWNRLLKVVCYRQYGTLFLESRTLVLYTLGMFSVVTGQTLKVYMFESL
jgi:hypothetical protein